jgi:hypothetical protein
MNSNSNNGQESFDFTAGLPVPAKDAIADAMERVNANADEDWKTTFDRCVVEAARKKQELTSDDVLEEYEAIPGRPVTHNLSAIGPAMLRAKNDGVLTSTGRVVRSVRSVKHGIRHTIWHSNIYQGAA